MANLGNYKIIKQIGEGGFGRIFQARHIILEELACLKQNINQSKEDFDILYSEAKILWKLNEHHSIPGAKDFFEAEKGSYVLVMDYIDGKTLENTLKDDKRFHPEDACWITERLLEALYYCHYNGVIHGDVKPENVFIEPKKHDIKLIDFGLASYKPKSKTMPRGYSPKYASPEVLQGKPPIPETDIFGAGIVLLYALGGNMEKRGFPKDVPEEVVKFCNYLLSYNPVERPNWEKDNPIKALSDIRQDVFGKRHLI